MGLSCWLIGFLAKDLKDRQDRLAFWMRHGLARFDHFEDFQPQVPARYRSDAIAI
jgi:hypothetical protein